jgi:hypothetical protein
MMFLAITDQAAEHSGRHLIDLLTLNFSTTTTASVAAAQMPVTTSMQHIWLWISIDHD